MASNLERAEKIRLPREIKGAIGSAGVAEVGALYKNDVNLADMARHAYEIDQVDRFMTHARLFFAGVVAFIAGMILQLLVAWPGCCTCIGTIPRTLGLQMDRRHVSTRSAAPSPRHPVSRRS
jgi:hypothetical protein